MVTSERTLRLFLTKLINLFFCLGTAFLEDFNLSSVPLSPTGAPIAASSTRQAQASAADNFFFDFSLPFSHLPPPRPKPFSYFSLSVMHWLWEAYSSPGKLTPQSMQATLQHSLHQVAWESTCFFLSVSPHLQANHTIVLGLGLGLWD